MHHEWGLEGRCPDCYDSCRNHSFMTKTFIPSSCHKRPNFPAVITNHTVFLNTRTVQWHKQPHYIELCTLSVTLRVLILMFNKGPASPGYFFNCGPFTSEQTIPLLNALRMSHSLHSHTGAHKSRTTGKNSLAR